MYKVNHIYTSADTYLLCSTVAKKSQNHSCQLYTLKQIRYLSIFFKQIVSTILICVHIINQYFYFIKSSFLR